MTKELRQAKEMLGNKIYELAMYQNELKIKSEELEFQENKFEHLEIETENLKS